MILNINQACFPMNGMIHGNTKYGNMTNRELPQTYDGLIQLE
jgi:hypothetical protein